MELDLDTPLLKKENNVKRKKGIGLGRHFRKDFVFFIFFRVSFLKSFFSKDSSLGRKKDKESASKLITIEIFKRKGLLLKSKEIHLPLKLKKNFLSINQREITLPLKLKEIRHFQPK